MDRYGEYLVKRLVGEGGMGKVYEGEERLSKRRVALKVLRAELSRSEEARRLFLNEMQILAHLEHPHIVRSLASLEVDGQLVLALEYLDGRTLRDELNARGRLPWPEAVAHAVAIAKALRTAHGQTPSVIHRDLKPENVMLTEGGGLKVMDFGIAKVLAAAQGTSTQSIGTLLYMSPEQIDARPIDGRSDLYALGLVLYEMLAGAPPFHSGSPRELLNMQCTASPPPLSPDVRRGLPRGVEALLFHLLQKAPEARPESAEEVVSRLSLFVSEDVAGVSQESAPAASPSNAASATDVRDAAEPNSAGRISGSSSGVGTSRSPSAPAVAAQPKLDTVAVVEGALSGKRGGGAGEGRDGRPREVSTRRAIAVALLLSILAFAATYAMRVAAAGGSGPALDDSNAPRPARTLSML